MKLTISSPSSFKHDLQTASRKDFSYELLSCSSSNRFSLAISISSFQNNFEICFSMLLLAENWNDTQCSDFIVLRIELDVRVDRFIVLELLIYFQFKQLTFFFRLIMNISFIRLSSRNRIFEKNRNIIFIRNKMC